MNKVELIGRLTRDPEIRYTQEQTAVARFSLAVDRRFAREGGKQADFINCSSFGKTAEFVEKYLKKGMKIALTGRLQQDDYTDRNGQKVTTYQVIAEEVEFCESKRTEQQNTDWQNVDKMDSEELPFNF